MLKSNNTLFLLLICDFSITRCLQYRVIFTNKYYKNTYVILKRFTTFNLKCQYVYSKWTSFLIIFLDAELNNEAFDFTLMNFSFLSKNHFIRNVNGLQTYQVHRNFYFGK